MTLPRRALPLLGVVLMAAFASVAPLALADTTGQTTLRLGGGAAGKLSSQGVKVRPVAPAGRSGKTFTLPVLGGLVGEQTTVLNNGGGLKLRGRDGTVKLTGLRLFLGGGVPYLGARLGGRQLKLLTISSPQGLLLDGTAGSAALASGKLEFTRGAAKRIQRKLDLDRRPFGTLGKIAVSAKGLIAGAESAGRASCPVPGATGPDPESPLVPLPQPPGSSALTAATLTWHVRESFIRYINTGEGAAPFGGATAGPAEVVPPSSTPLVYRFSFPFASGWHSEGAAPGPADDLATADFGGGVEFSFASHGIALETAAPHIEIDGATSRAVFTVDGTQQVLANLDLGSAASVARAGSTITYDRIPGTVPGGTASGVFNGFYAPGEAFGCFSLSLSLAP